MKGLKLYQDVFTGTQLSKLLDSMNQLRESGRNHQLSGDFTGIAFTSLIRVFIPYINLTSFSHLKFRGDICSVQQEHERNQKRASSAWSSTFRQHHG